jgi:hypothetical protein
LDAAAHIKDNRNELMWLTCAIHRWAKMCIEAEGGHFEQLMKQSFYQILVVVILNNYCEFMNKTLPDILYAFSYFLTSNIDSSITIKNQTYVHMKFFY